MWNQNQLDRGHHGGGGRTSAQRVEDSAYILPLHLSPEILLEDSARMGWKELTYDKNQNVTIPKSRGVGHARVQTITVTTNNLLLKYIKLPQTVYQYDLYIDMTNESKAKLRKKKGGDDKKWMGKHNGPSIPNPQGGSSSKEYEPKPKLWKKMVQNILYPRLIAENPGRPIATDFCRALYSTAPLVINENGYGFDLKELEDESGDSAYFCIVTLVSQIQTAGQLSKCINNHKEWFAVRGLHVPENLVKLEQVLNIVVKTTLHERYTSVGRLSFYPKPKDEDKECYSLGGGLVNWKGFSTVFGMGWKPFITVDVANTAFLKGQSVYQALNELKYSDRGFNGDPRDGNKWKKWDVEKALKLLKGCFVEYNTSISKLSGRVTDIFPAAARTFTFTNKDGQKTNVEAHFKRSYNISLKNPNGICLQIRGKATVPAEICFIKKGQPFNSKLNDCQTREMIRNTAVPPRDRRCEVQKIVNDLAFNKDPVMVEFGLAVETTLHKVNEARVLPMPKLVYGSAAELGKQKHVTPPRDGVWNMFYNSDLMFVQPASKAMKLSWGVINLAASNGMRRNDVLKFVQKLCLFAKRGGLNLGAPEEAMNYYFEVEPDPKNFRPTLELFGKRSITFAVIILAQKREEDPLYSYVKTTSEILLTVPVLTQCVIRKNVEKCDDATVQNILFKINSKTGGINYYVHPQHPWNKVDLLRIPVLVIGADVTHPGTDSKYPSFAAVTGSYDRTGMPYMLHIQAQRNENKGAAEVIDGLDKVVEKFIREFCQRTGYMPRKIIYYRDGVGDSQFGEVLNTEMMAIRRGCEIISSKPEFLALCVHEQHIENILTHPQGGRNYQPKITFLAVQKRHNVRFFVDNERDGVGKMKNAPPGTVVDTDIVDPTRNDFYLLSHTGIQGTSRPTHYVLLWDDSDHTPDELQLLSFYLCFMFCRCTRSVAYPAATYYAHLGATRAKVYARTLGDKILSDIKKTNQHIKRNDLFQESFPMHFV